MLCIVKRYDHVFKSSFDSLIAVMLMAYLSNALVDADIELEFTKFYYHS